MAVSIRSEVSAGKLSVEHDEDGLMLVYREGIEDSDIIADGAEVVSVLEALLAFARAKEGTP
jgi:hypothetical protein